ncbi:putative response regulator [Burkholderiales bacterium]|jgi:response regulator NasT|nr:putative response regulator [Burkholderiales bacterium]
MMTDQTPLVLVVDDDRLVLATLCAGLRQAGIEVIEADNGDEAILLARRHKPQLAILDMRMQGKSGMDVARYLAANTRTGFMFLSAFNDSETIEEANRLGALGYLVKPLDVKQIVPAVHAALAQTADADALPVAAGFGRGQRDEQVAVGILMERLRLDYDHALDALRNQARMEGASIEALATSMVEAANRLNSIPRS